MKSITNTNKSEIDNARAIELIKATALKHKKFITLLRVVERKNKVVVITKSQECDIETMNEFIEVLDNYKLCCIELSDVDTANEFYFDFKDDLNSITEKECNTTFVLSLEFEKIKSNEDELKILKSISHLEIAKEILVNHDSEMYSIEINNMKELQHALIHLSTLNIVDENNDF